jgi:hypothetical protein
VGCLDSVAVAGKSRIEVVSQAVDVIRNEKHALLELPARDTEDLFARDHGVLVSSERCLEPFHLDLLTSGDSLERQA